MKVLIAGGGIGGLTLALCLAKSISHEIEVFEQAPLLEEVGAGIQLSPNCSRVLHQIGLQSALQSKGFLPEATRIRSWRTGKILSETALGQSAVDQFGAPYYHMHRGDLTEILAKACGASAQIRLRTGVQVERFDDTGSQVSVVLKTDQVSTEASGDVLVGADGIHSMVRAGLWGTEAPEFTGNIAWRALVPVERLPKGLIEPMSTVWWGPGKHFVHYYVRSGELVNCVCVVEKEGWDIESWTQRGDVEELTSDFAGWQSKIQKLISNVDKDSLYKWALYDRPPMPHWGRGRVTLLGDACHPTLPFMAQGAAMAIEDAAVLSKSLSETRDIETSLQDYETIRKARTASIQTGSRRNAKIFHMSGAKAWLRDRAVKTVNPMDKIYRYNVLEDVQQKLGDYTPHGSD